MQVGVQSTTINMAYAVGPLAGGVLADSFGCRASFVIVGTAAAVSSLLFTLVPETLARRTDKTAEKCVQQTGWWEVYGPLLRSPDQQAAMAVSFAIFSSYSTLMTIMPLHAMHILGEAGSMSQVGTLFGASALMGFVGAPLGGFLADRIGRKATVHPSIRKHSRLSMCIPFVEPIFLSG